MDCGLTSVSHHLNQLELVLNLICYVRLDITFLTLLPESNVSNISQAYYARYTVNIAILARNPHNAN